MFLKYVYPTFPTYRKLNDLSTKKFKIESYSHGTGQIHIKFNFSHVEITKYREKFMKTYSLVILIHLKK